MKYLLLFLSVFLLSCNNNKSVLLTKKGEVFFGLKNALSYSRKGIFFDRKTKKELVFFADAVTNKKILFFDVNGVLNDSVDLKEVTKTFEKPLNIKIISKDSILYLNKEFIVLINKKGEIKNVVDLMKLTANDTSNDVYKFLPSFSNNYIEENKNIIFSLDWQYHKNNKDNYDFKNYYIDAFKKPSIVRFDNFLTDSVSYVYEKENVFKNVFDKPKKFGRGIYYKKINDKNFIISLYSNYLLQFDEENLKVAKKILIESDYTKIGHKAFDINEEFNDVYNMPKGILTNIFYDKKIGCYYVVVLHKIEFKNDEIDYKKLDERPFSIIKYDTDFKKLNEFVFNKEKSEYLVNGIFQTEKGLLILNNDNNEKKLRFSIF